jgi:hypothetical protein
MLIGDDCLLFRHVMSCRMSCTHHSWRVCRCSPSLCKSTITMHMDVFLHYPMLRVLRLIMPALLALQFFQHFLHCLRPFLSRGYSSLGFLCRPVPRFTRSSCPSVISFAPLASSLCAASQRRLGLCVASMPRLSTSPLSDLQKRRLLDAAF